MTTRPATAFFIIDFAFFTSSSFSAVIHLKPAYMTMSNRTTPRKPRTILITFAIMLTTHSVPEQPVLRPVPAAAAVKPVFAGLSWAKVTAGMASSIAATNANNVLKVRFME